MPVEEQLATIFEVIEGGVETTAEVIPFPADAGASALEGTTTAVQLGNGVATEVSQLTVVEGGANTTAGVGLLAMDVGTVGLAIAPALGIIAGVGLYNLAPEFWTNVANKLTEAGQTVGGKVRAFLNGETKQAGFSKETIEIFKEAFMEAGLFDSTTENAEADVDFSNYQTPTSVFKNNLSTITAVISEIQSVANTQNLINMISAMQNYNGVNYFESYPAVMYKIYKTNNYNEITAVFWFVSSYQILDNSTMNLYGVRFEFSSPNYISSPSFVYTGSSPMLNVRLDAIYFPPGQSNMEAPVINGEFVAQTVGSNTLYLQYLLSAIGSLVQKYTDGRLYRYELVGRNFGFTVDNPNIQPDATLPSADPFPTTYPTWTPWTLPEGLPEIYPVELPVVNPDATQEIAQSPDEIPDNDSVLEWLMEVFPIPDPIINPEPTPTPDPDPDPQPEPDPIPEPEPEPTDPNPIDPNPTPTPSPLPIIPDLPDTVESNAMFTVYKPSMTQVNAFGGWLWSTNIVEQIKRIWQNPLDGIISFMKVYVDAPTSGSDTIKVGVLDSEVSSPVVSGQFVTVECGSLNVSEKFYNATDYSPFVSMHLYLPFIGIVELDIDEFMSGEIKVTYHVDVYTGTCLAEVKSRRSPDMPEWTIVYTFSGNASQQLPLTSAEFSGALSSLVGVVGGGLAVASGGGLGLLAGASGIAHAVSHEMVHLAHSGSLSANAGIMGARTPYLILTRRRSYDANGYSELYGYPSNKTVFLNNCSGYVKVKDIRLETSATDSERLEIENLLKGGVII